MSEIIDKAKAKLEDMFDGKNDHTNIIDNIEDSMLDDNINKKIEEQLKKIDQ